MSGGQTGVDRGALDAALEAGFPCGGWCPRGRRAEDGTIDSRYPLAETPTEDYRERTEWNVRDADGTLILGVAPLSGGTARTADLAQTLGKPCLVAAPDGGPDAIARVLEWVLEHGIRVLNVAGPRESGRPGIGATARVFVGALIAEAGRWRG